MNTFAYTYDFAGNRLTEQIDGSTRQFFNNTLNELTMPTLAPEVPATYQWDAEHRLVSVEARNRLTFFDYNRILVQDLASASWWIT